MTKLSAMLDGSVANIPGVDMEQIRKARRVEAVRRMWKGLVPEIFLEHTNNVFVFDKDGRREMHVYVDDSLFAAELNAQREIIKWRCLEEFGEKVDEFHIHVSRGSYKDLHPFADGGDRSQAPAPVEPLCEQDAALVESACASIDDPKLKEVFREAMISDLQWKRSQER